MICQPHECGDGLINVNRFRFSCVFRIQVCFKLLNISNVLIYKGFLFLFAETNFTFFSQFLNLLKTQNQKNLQGVPNSVPTLFLIHSLLIMQLGLKLV